jgi:hypothetical protein
LTPSTATKSPKTRVKCSLSIAKLMGYDLYETRGK